MEWLAGRTRLESVLTVYLSTAVPALPASDQPVHVWEEAVEDALQQQAKDAEIVGAVMDHLGHAAARSIYESRPSTPSEGTT